MRKILAMAASAALTVIVLTLPARAADPYGFGGWLNGVRAGYGLPPVGHDPNLDGWAYANSAEMASFNRLAHNVMGAARRQNAGWGHYSQMGALWLASPPHRAALLDPTIRFYGIAGYGAWWTFNGR